MRQTFYLVSLSSPFPYLAMAGLPSGFIRSSYLSLLSYQNHRLLPICWVTLVFYLFWLWESNPGNYAQQTSILPLSYIPNPPLNIKVQCILDYLLLLQNKLLTKWNLHFSILVINQESFQSKLGVECSSCARTRKHSAPIYMPRQEPQHNCVPSSMGQQHKLFYHPPRSSLLHEQTVTVPGRVLHCPPCLWYNCPR